MSFLFVSVCLSIYRAFLFICCFVLLPLLPALFAGFSVPLFICLPVDLSIYVYIYPFFLPIYLFFFSIYLSLWIFYVYALFATCLVCLFILFFSHCSCWFSCSSAFILLRLFFVHLFLSVNVSGYLFVIFHCLCLFFSCKSVGFYVPFSLCTCLSFYTPTYLSIFIR